MVEHRQLAHLLIRAIRKKNSLSHVYSHATFKKMADSWYCNSICEFHPIIMAGSIFLRL